MKKSLFFFLFLVFIFILKPKNVAAQSLSFDPTLQGVTAGQQFAVKISINTSSSQTSGADAYIKFDSTKIKLVDATNGGFYTGFGWGPISGKTDEYVINAFENPPVTDLKSGTGVMANLTFEGVSNGTSTLSFVCGQSSGADTNIIDGESGDDVVNCGSLGSGSYTVGPANATPITEDTSSNPTPSSLPRSGSTEVTFIALGVGVLLAVVGLVFLL